MTGKGIPHRYTLKRSNTLRKRDVNEVALDFKAVQAYAAAQPYLNPMLSLKALSPGAKAANVSKPKAAPERTAAPSDDEPQIKLNFNPKAKRKPGQVLKLHVSYDELTSKEGATFGWVDPTPRPTEEQLKDGAKQYADAISKRPTAAFRQYEKIGRAHV